MIKPIVCRLTDLYSAIFILILISIHFGAYLWEYIINDFVVDTASNKIGNYFLFYIGEFSAIGYWSIICNKIQSIILLNYIGRNAIIVLLFHYPIIQLMRATFMPYLSFLKDYSLYGW